MSKGWVGGGRHWCKLMSVHEKGGLPKWNKWKQGRGGSKLWSSYDNVIIQCPPDWIILTFVLLIMIASSLLKWRNVLLYGR